MQILKLNLDCQFSTVQTFIFLNFLVCCSCIIKKFGQNVIFNSFSIWFCAYFSSEATLCIIHFVCLSVMLLGKIIFLMLLIKIESWNELSVYDLHCLSVYQSGFKIHLLVKATWLSMIFCHFTFFRDHLTSVLQFTLSVCPSIFLLCYLWMLSSILRK